MYAPFFGLSKEPFSIAPDPRFLFMSAQHREALAHLLYGLDGGGGFVLLTGEIGAGKTTVCRCFLEQVPAHCRLAYVFNPKLDAVELLQTVCTEFGITLRAADEAGDADQAGADSAPRGVGETRSVKRLVDALNRFLLEAHAQGQQAVLVIDEAQSLSADVLEQLRLLTNLETAERKLLQIVLIGQPELRAMLARPELEQLAQRVIARYHLGALDAAETPQYIRHRLAVAGPAAALPFDPGALARIHALSGGVPRRINLLADRALLGAYALGKARADRQVVDQAAREVFGPRAERPLPWRVLALAAGGVAAVAVMALATLLWTAPRQRSAPPSLAGAGSAPAPGAAGASAASVAFAAFASSRLVPSEIDLRPAPVASQAEAVPAVAGSQPASQVSPAPTSMAATAERSTMPAPAGDDPSALLAAAAGSAEATAWRELALRWNVAIGEGEPCSVATQARLACFRSPNGGLAMLRLLARPALLTLQAPGGRTSYAVLTGLDAHQASLQVGGRSFSLQLPALAQIWRGELATFWRLPPAWRGGSFASDRQASDWLDRELAGAGIRGPEPLRERVFSFQLAQGLPADGLPGPLTLMRLNRIAGIDEPRLQEP